MTKVKIDLGEALVQQLGSHTTHIPATIDLDEFLDFTDIQDHEIDIDDLLADQHAIGIVWDIEHVKDQRPDLTDEQAWEVLQECQRNWDRALDPMLETIRQVAENLYPSGKEALRRRARSLLNELEALPEREIDNPAGYGQVAAKLDSLESEAKGA